MAGPDSDRAIDDAILASVGARWRKVAMIIAKAEPELEQSGIAVSFETVSGRFAALVQSGRLESAGNLSNWRYSEVRLPPDAQ